MTLIPRSPRTTRAAMAALCVGVASLLAACGGGGGSAPAVPVPPASAVIAGTAAFGAAVANATVSITDRAGASVCANDPVTTDDTGAYRCTLKDGVVAPFAIVVTDPEGLINPMISIIDTAPAAGSESTANVTPLTTAIAAQLDVNKDPFALVKNPAALADLNVATLNAVKANVVAQLAEVLADAGVDVATFDPIKTPFTGGNRTGVDRMLDQVRVTFDNGAPQLSNALNPDAPSVPLADANTSTPQTVSKSAVVAGEFALAELDIFKTELEKCFAVPSTSRATTVTSGVLDDLHADCLNSFTVQDTPGVDGPFKNNGYGPELFWHGLMTSPDMDGARFNLPELLRFIKRDDGKDEALVNLKFRDRNGYIDNRLLLAKKFPGSRASGSQWWLYGNQRPIDAYIRPAIRKIDQNIADSVFNGTTLFDLSAPRDRYESGLEIFIRRPNAGNNNPNTDVHYVKVTGPGLPDAGLVYANVQNLPQSWMAILNTDGTVPMGTGTYANTGQLATSSNIFLLQRTRGIAGTEAFTIRPNPGVGNSTPTTRLWAHPTMYGASAAADWTFDLSQVKSWSRYTFAVYDGTSSSTPVSTFSAVITLPVMPAAYAATQQWHSFTDASFAFVTDGAAAVGSVDIGWTINSLAERIGSVNAYSFGPNGQANSASLNAPKGATSVTAPAASGSPMLYNPISSTNNGAGRTLQIRHQMMDGSYKDHLIRFN